MLAVPTPRHAFIDRSAILILWHIAGHVAAATVPSPAAVDEGGALGIMQWVLSTSPDPATADQQLHAALKLVG